MINDFDVWISGMKKTINDLGYYVNFDKVYDNVNEIKLDLNILNSLIGSKNIKEEFESLISRYPRIIKCIPILIAVSKKEIYAYEDKKVKHFNFDYKDKIGKDEVKVYSYFMEKTGLFRLISERIVANLVDYVLGVEVGLDSHSRKNRAGKTMESLVESKIKVYINEYNKNNTDSMYIKNMSFKGIQKKYGDKLIRKLVIKSEAESDVENKLEEMGLIAVKKWDFIVLHNNVTYLIETNFYSGGGSKLNETSRSYELISRESNKINGVKFVWITDGAGWDSAKSDLHYVFDKIEHIYNLEELENEAFKVLFGI